jgi:hypothetical protein
MLKCRRFRNQKITIYPPMRSGDQKIVERRQNTRIGLLTGPATMQAFVNF